MNNVTAFHEAAGLIRQFFLLQGFIEVDLQHRLSVFAACDDPERVASFTFNGQKWPLPQTSQLGLEYELLQNPHYPGFFCVTTRYQQDPDSTRAEHETISSLIEFVTYGEIDELVELEERLLAFLGFGPMKDYAHASYQELAALYGTQELTAAHEHRIEAEFGSVCFVKDFPKHTGPFWNVKYNQSTANKVDLLLYGMKSVRATERSCDPVAMRKQFTTLNNGTYAQVLYDQFGEERVQEELDAFLAQTFFPRSGGRIDITRIIRAMQQAGILGEQLKMSGLRLGRAKGDRKFAK